MAEEKKQADWLAIEKDYRAGSKSLRQIAGEHGISEGAIRKRAKRDEWVRDLSDKVRQKADELVRDDAVRSTGTRAPGGDKTPTERATEREIVEANAEVQAHIRREHRRDIGRLRRLANSLADELEVTSESREEIERGIALLAEGDQEGAARAMQRAMSMSGRITSLESLSRTLANLVKLEREAFGIDKDEKSDDSGYEAMLKRAIAASEAQSQE